MAPTGASVSSIPIHMLPSLTPRGCKSPFSGIEEKGATLDQTKTEAYVNLTSESWAITGFWSIGLRDHGGEKDFTRLPLRPTAHS